MTTLVFDIHADGLERCCQWLERQRGPASGNWVTNLDIERHGDRYRLVVQTIDYPYLETEARKLIGIGGLSNEVRAERDRCVRIAQKAHDYWRDKSPNGADVAAALDIAAAIRDGDEPT